MDGESGEREEEETRVEEVSICQSGRGERLSVLERNGPKKKVAEGKKT